ncbi:MDR family MFS transporter [Rhodococcus sp. NPDC003318]|uniref:MDR family MFS transporter n=1 Tax=Rhodococcus sp. NPDC003318 TaxID=3364503 RepID=UPI0036CBDE78
MTPAEPDISGDVPRDTTRVNLLFCGLMVTMLLASLNQTVLSPALPTIVGELHGVDQMLWAITTFTLATTVVMPAYGKLSDTFGRKPLLVIAISIFITGSACCGLAMNMTWLIASRAIQGLGAGGLMILAQAAIADVIPARERGKYMGIMSSVFAVSSLAGPLLGGWLTEGPGWRWVFWLNILVGLVALLSALVFLRLPRRERTDQRIDTAGIAVLALATTGLVLISGWGGTTYDWTSPPILALGVGTAVAVAAFVAIERRSPAPVMPPHLFRERNFICCTIAGLAMGVAMFGSTGYLPTYLQMATGAEATEAGLTMIPMMISMMVVSTVTGRVISATGRYKAFPIAGTLVVALALVLLSTISLSTPVWRICVTVGVMGAGLGMTLQVLMLIVQNTFPGSEVGTATAANNYFRQIGATLGASVVGSLFVSRLVGLLDERVSSAGSSMVSGDSVTLTPATVLTLPKRYACRSSSPTTTPSSRSSASSPRWRSWRPSPCCSSWKHLWPPRPRPSPEQRTPSRPTDPLNKAPASPLRGPQQTRPTAVNMTHAIVSAGETR